MGSCCLVGGTPIAVRLEQTDPMTTPVTDNDATPPVMLSEDDERALIAQTEQAVASTYPNALQCYKPSVYVRNPANENRVLLDARQRPITVDRILATKPLRQDLSSRPGPGGRRLTYISGEGISRSLNEIFGHEGWSLDIKSVTQTGKEQDKRGRWNVAYLAHVRITLARTGTYKEDMGSGESIDSSLQTAVSHAMKASITDALKRAARHFGEKLGNALYEADFAINKAPTNLYQALEEYEKSAREKWGVSNVPNPPNEAENRKPTTTTSGAAVLTTPATAAATKMPPPLPSAAVAAANQSSLPPTVTPNVNNKPINVYQRHSLGGQIPTSTHSSAAVNMDPSVYATPRTSSMSSMITPLTTLPNSNNHAVAPPQPMRPILAENSAAANPAPPPFGMHTNFANNNNLQHQPVPMNHNQQQHPIQRPASSWGVKRPHSSSEAPVTSEPPKQRTRHNPYA